ncbi:autotransporter domain-containing protein [Comamonas sp. 26]|uniref:autotransporter domain-containing protein n=1 Tax=Comamonas sp. 26 TaxID=2035201 RepID=UPI000C37CD77|nr:autotransporter domain-containing protein [Comamonas sp. 26]PIG09264.1 autotransporter-associated beta strand protein/T5SS/PEP-CTERM-associated repeat protein [Comamonas sp. 26]
MTLKVVFAGALCLHPQARAWPMALVTALLFGGPVQLVQAQVIEASGDVDPFPPPSPGPVWNIGGSLSVGKAGTGALTIRDGAVVKGANGHIGEQAGSNGTVTVTDKDSSWTSAGGLTIGERGTGRLSILDQAQVVSRDGTLGDWDSGSGEVLVSGVGSRWGINSSFLIGISGSGLLNIQNGGVVSSNFTSLGLSSGRGQVAVSGAGSAWLNAFDITIGDSGFGELLVKEGGLVRTDTAYIGSFEGSRGTGLVSGSGALWESGALSVGVGGSASLQLRDGGRMSVSGSGVDLATYSTASGAIYIGAASNNPSDAVAPGTLETAQLRFGEGSGTLNFNHTGSAYAFAAALSSAPTGSHQINHYAGVTRLTGDSLGFLGQTRVQGGTLIVDQRLGGTALVNAGQLQVNGSFAGPVSVEQTGTLTGSGTVNGAVRFSNGGVLSGVQGQTLTVVGNLSLDSASDINAAFGAPGSTVLFRIGGDLVLDGNLHVSDIGGFGRGIYRLFDYGGALTDKGLLISTSPTGIPAGELHIQTEAKGQINVVSALGATLRAWDGGNTSLDDNGVIDGGSGTWRADGASWTEVDGALNGPYQPNPGFVIFQGTAGTVTVDRSAGSIGIMGAQFASDGYRIDGDSIDLQGENGMTMVRVGDGTAAGAGMSATITASLTGASQLVKTDMGTLVLGGRNTYSGGSKIDSGVLSVSSDANLGAASGGIELNGGTLATTSSFDTGRTITLSTAAGRVQVASNTELGMTGAIVGRGGLVKQGLGTLRLDNVSSTYSGATEVAQGRLLAGAANVLSQGSAHTVAAGAVLDIAGRSQSIAALNNSGLVMLSDPNSSRPGTVLKITGPYVGNSGALSLSAKLQGPGSASDMLLLSGRNAVASGNTTLVVNNAGGLGAKTDTKGIVVVGTENGASLSPGAFTLAGGQVDAGAFEYRLKSDASGASLHSSINGIDTSYRAEASLISSLPSQLRQADLTLVGNRQQRVGDDINEGGDGRQVRQTWGRLIRSEPRISQPGLVSARSRAVLTGFQVGLDVWANGDWKTGLYVGQLSGDVQVLGFSGGQQGQDVGFNSLRNRYIGVYSSYQNAQNFYLDAVLQAADYRSELYTRSNARALTKGHGWLASLELGQPLPLHGGWQIEPQAQLIYRSMSLADTTLGTTRVGIRADNDWLLRLGARIKGRFPTSVGVFQPSVRVNLFHASRATDVASFMTSSTTTAIPARGGYTSTELAVGGTLKLNPMTSVYAELNKLWANGGDTRVKTGVQAILGVKRSW